MRYLSLPALLYCIPRVWGDSSWPTYITVPSVTEAGVPIHATINVQWHGLADSSYAYAFRIYLASSYKDTRHYFYHPDCESPLVLLRHLVLASNISRLHIERAVPLRPEYKGLLGLHRLL